MERKRVPLIDMQKVEGLGEELVKACEEWGCFRMVNHGLPAELMAEMKVVAASLLDLPDDIKRKTLSAENYKGYRERNVITSFFEALSIDDISSPDEFCDRLDASVHQREIIYKYIKAIHDLVGLLGRKLMEGVGLAGDLFDGWDCQLRMNKYHFRPENIGLTGLLMHSDPTFLTVIQDDENVDGLQVVDKYSGQIIPVDPVPDTLLINVGDIAKAWSNGRFYNVKHRVCSLEPKTRYSIVLSVLGPKGKVEVPPGLLDSKHPRLYIPFDLKEYMDVRYSTKLHTGGAVDLFSTKME
ncbi:hypothetical protein L2E82_37390 [Cichorium intybus]|uniref:Uncharacterized protein n=1 Tax=Cichorium intybus TaxID=13427 RepID=A0ACB9AF05_CICIN|nr:hypothetical protein L2E82_37390 [Cichorium intybus]